VVGVPISNILVGQEPYLHGIAEVDLTISTTSGEGGLSPIFVIECAHQHKIEHFAFVDKFSVQANDRGSPVLWSAGPWS
jgi:hypothetical protein